MGKKISVGKDRRNWNDIYIYSTSPVFREIKKILFLLVILAKNKTQKLSMGTHRPLVRELFGKAILPRPRKTKCAYSLTQQPYPTF